MKIAMPITNGKLSMHFGHAQEFAFFQVDEAEKQIISREMLVPPGYAPGMLPQWLKEQGANMLIACGIGQRAQDLLSNLGIKIVIGAPEETPQSIVSSYLNGTLQAGSNICDH